MRACAAKSKSRARHNTIIMKPPPAGVVLNSERRNGVGVKKKNIEKKNHGRDDVKREVYIMCTSSIAAGYINLPTSIRICVRIYIARGCV